MNTLTQWHTTQMLICLSGRSTTDRIQIDSLTPNRYFLLGEDAVRLKIIQKSFCICLRLCLKNVCFKKKSVYIFPTARKLCLNFTHACSHSNHITVYVGVHYTWPVKLCLHESAHNCF